MKQKFIQILTVLITTAFVGLIAIQIYWVNNSILLRQQEFEFNVNQALKSVVHKLEKLEYYKQVGQDRKGKSLSVRLDKSSEKKSILYNFGTEETDTIRLETPKDGVPRPIDIGVGNVELIEDNPEETLKELKRNQDSVMYSEWGEYGLSQSDILEQAFLEDILKGNMSVDILKSVEDRVDELILDSLLHQELLAQGVKATFRYGVFNKYDQPEILTGKNQKCKEALLKEGSKVRLYPNDTLLDPSYLRIFFPHARRYLLRNMWVMLSISGILILVIMFAFSYTIITIYRQKKLSLIKNDFINNMTHELKTPISTISLACEALSDPDMMQSEKGMKTFVGMINDENKRLGQLVENVLRSAILDKGDMELRLEAINVHDLIKNVIKNIAIQVKKKGGTINTNFHAVNPVIHADRIHLTNLVFNLIDNAIKYSLDCPSVIISSEDREDGLMLSFEDTGIGISKENQKKIFDRLFRVPTGNVHDVKGFGLGLSYVQAVVERHHGTITVVSELNKGSIFTIYLPKDHEKSD